ncbi:sulfite exporter TauE/SafE family protein [Paenibacillus sp. IB182496]|uniref:Probable membrane transporter protein n=1 Tax=Paenibacillus sabuli TaxID=2772509 RepID=A0A927BSR1_9BACL|nr:sulfite exporter TauE/SafE family protein [Paenibacillus sabuli]MBD2844824.1 sulfite exporter TauE/SafE family protein [Paenibacillus sabuli]
MDITYVQLSVLAACAVLIGFSKTGVPTLGLFVAAIMATVFPARESVGLMLPILIVGDIIAIVYYRRAVVWKHLLTLMPWVLIGLVAGYLVLGRIDNDGLSTLIGSIVLALIVLHVFRERLETSLKFAFSKTRAWSGGLGVLAGFTTMIGNAAGSIMSIYLLAKRMDKTAFVGTGAFFFFSVNLIKVPFNVHLGLVNTESLLLNAWMIPAVVIGAFSGFKVLPLIPQKHFQVIVLVLATLGGLNLILF